MERNTYQMKFNDGSVESVHSECRKFIESCRAESIRAVISDYKAALKSITEAFNERMAKYDVQIVSELTIKLKPLQKKEPPNYGEEYRTDRH